MKIASIKKTLRIGAVAFIALLTTHCSPFDDPYQPIEGNVNLRLYEKLDSTERQIILIIETERIYDCENYIIWNNTSVEDSTLTIELERIYAPDVCYTNRGPAIATFNISNLADSIFKVNIKMEGFERSGYITKLKDKYHIEMDNAAPLLIAEPEINRIPENVIWGMIEYDNPFSEAYIDTFFMQLDSAGAFQNSYANGEYNFFQVKNGAIVNPGSNNSKLSKAFLLDYNGSFDFVAQKALEAAYYSQDIQIRVFADNPFFFDTQYP